MLKSLIEQRSSLILTRHRGLIVVDGSAPTDPSNPFDQALLSVAQACCHRLGLSRALMVNNPPPVDSDMYVKTGPFHYFDHSQKLERVLGQEFDAVFWQLGHGLHPDVLGAISGVIKAGGLLFLFIEDADTLDAKPDLDYQRMCASNQVFKQCGTFFLRRCQSLLLRSNQATVIQFNELRASLQSWQCQPQVEIPLLTSYQEGLNEAQQAGLNLITQIATDDRHQALVLTADRGRGKTFLLGAAVRRILNAHPNYRIVITAPNLAALKSACIESPEINELFCVPDQILTETPPADILLIDEAAAIPVPILQTCLERYQRVIFATTIHGYEGCGQGFAVRFKSILKDMRPDYISLHLDEPIRWAAGDPLEHLVAKTLHLSAELSPPEHDLTESTDLTFKQVSQDQLANDDALLGQIIALLVTAHYQTSSDDLRFILDHPHVRIFVSLHHSVVLGVTMCLDESNIEAHFDAQDLETRDLIDGRRRLRGYLVPQSLARFHNDDEFFTLSGLRIVRIATHPEARRLGIGQRLIQACCQHAIAHGMDYLSVSYGLYDTLHRFWDRNGFISQKLGYTKDKSSGAVSVIATLSLSERGKNCLSRYRRKFVRHLIFGLERYYGEMQREDLLRLLREGDEKDQGDSEVTLDTYLKDKVQYAPDRTTANEPFSIATNERDSVMVAVSRFASGKITEYDVLEELYMLAMECSATNTLSILTDAEADLVRARILHNLSWQDSIQQLGLSGQKAGTKLLRQAFEKLSAKV